MPNYIITGSAGFIGSHAVDTLLQFKANRVIGLDSLSYSGNIQNLPVGQEHFRFLKCNISNSQQVQQAFSVAKFFFGNQPFVVLNFAAESHVDRSIKSGIPFVESNVLGTQILIENAVTYGAEKFIQVSTDEVYGSLESEIASENFPLNPSSPYAASKASADLLLQAFYRTHGFPVMITRCVNNFGSRQLNEKLIPRFMYLASKDSSLPIYGSGQNIREWIPVSVHVSRIIDVLTSGRPGEIYNIGSGFRLSNLEIAKLILDTFPTKSQILHVEDRLGHDQRYAVNSKKGEQEFGWKAETNLKIELQDTMKYYWDLYKNLNDEDEKSAKEVENFYN
jgi:dTDP-glucose 4,6-dehydratase